MLARNTAAFIYILLVILLIFLGISGLFFLLVNYQNLVDFAISGIGRPDLYDEVTGHFFTQEKYGIIKKISFLTTAAGIVGLWLVFKFRQRILPELQYCVRGFLLHAHNFFAALRQNSRTVNVLLVLVLCGVAGRSIYYACHFYIQHDEAWNYNYFLNKNILFTFFAYNNYPLHNVLTWFFLKMMPAETFALRLPSMLAGIATCVFVFVVIKKICRDQWIALSAVLIFAALPVSVFYMLYARGVMFEMFFCTLITYLMFRYLQQEHGKRKIIFLALLNALGTFSMLSHVYFIFFTFLAAGIYFLFQKKINYRFLIFYPLLSLVFSLVLLLPMLGGTGISLGAQAAFSSFNFLSLHQLPYHCYSTFMSGAWFVFYLLTALNILMFFIDKEKRYRFFCILNFCLLLSPLVIRLVTQTYPPERAMAFLFIIPVTTMAILFSLTRMGRWITLTTSIAIFLLVSYAAHVSSFLNWSKELDKEVYILSRLLKEGSVREIRYSSPKFQYCIPAIQYYYSRQDLTVHFSTTLEQSTRYSQEPLPPADVLITDSVLTGQTLLFSMDGFNVYTAWDQQN